MRGKFTIAMSALAGLIAVIAGTPEARAKAPVTGEGDYARSFCSHSEPTASLDVSSGGKLLESVCQMVGGGALDPRLATHIRNLTAIIDGNPAWKKDKELDLKVRALYRDTLDLANQGRATLLAKKLKGAGTAQSEQERGFLASVGKFATRCERGATDADCLAGPPKATEAQQSAKWKKYIAFLTKAANQTATGAKALEAAERAAHTAPFVGLEVREMPADLRKIAEGTGVPVETPPGSGKFKMVLYLNPTEDPIQAISTLAHEATHASHWDANQAKLYQTMEDNRPDYDETKNAYGEMKKLNDYMTTQVCWRDAGHPDACSLGGKYCAPPKVNSSFPCKGSGGDPYLRKDGLSVSTSSPAPDGSPNLFNRTVAREHFEEAEARHFSLWNNDCKKLVKMGLECKSELDTRAALMTLMMGMPGSSPSLAREAASDLAKIKRYAADKEAARHWQDAAEGKWSAQFFRDGYPMPSAAMPVSGWNQIKARHEKARDAYLPVRKFLSNDAVVDEYRAHAVTWKTLSDLEALYPSAVCTRMIRSRRYPDKLVPAAKMAEEDRNEYFCGDYLCRRIALPYTEEADGINEADIFEGKSWNFTPEVVANLSQPDQWRNQLNGPPRCTKTENGKTVDLPVQPIRTDCSADVKAPRGPAGR